MNRIAGAAAALCIGSVLATIYSVYFLFGSLLFVLIAPSGFPKHGHLEVIIAFILLPTALIAAIMFAAATVSRNNRLFLIGISALSVWVLEIAISLSLN